MNKYVFQKFRLTIYEYNQEVFLIEILPFAKIKLNKFQMDKTNIYYRLLIGMVFNS